MHKGEEGTELTLIKEEFTSECNGVTIKVPLKSRYDIRDFADAAKYQLCYFEDVFIDIYGVDKDFKIVKSTDWKWSSLYPGDEMHLCLDNVYYPISWKDLKIDPIEIPVGLNFSVSDGITPTPNRESILMTPTTRSMIMEKIRKVCTWLAEEYNKKMQFTSFTDILDYEPYLGSLIINPEDNASIKLPEVTVNKYSDVPMSHPVLSYAPDLDMKDILYKKEHLMADHPVIKLWRQGAWRKRSETGRTRYRSNNVPKTLPLKSKAIIIEPNTPISRVTMDYIKDTHADVFIVHKKERVDIDPLQKLGDGGYWSYFTGGGVTIDPNKVAQIQTICKELSDKYVVHYDNIVPDEDWLQRRKDSKAKSNRVKKEKAQVYPRFSRVGGHDEDRMIFDDRQLIELTEVKQSVRVVYGNEDQKELLQDIAAILRTYRKSDIQCCIISKTDEKRLQGYDLKNWVKVSDFMTNSNKVLGRYLTALRIENINQENPLLFGEAKVISPKLQRDIKELKTYMHSIINGAGSKYRKFQASDELIKELMIAATKGNWWDSSILGKIEEIEQELPLLDFVDNLSRHTDSIDGDNKTKKTKLKVMREVYIYRKLKQQGKIKL